jgi:hypothetical protein
VEDIRKRIKDFLFYMHWSEATMNRALDWPRGRVNYILTHPTSRISVEECQQIERVMEEKTPSGVDAPSPIPMTQVSSRENLLTALVLFASATRSEKLRKMCSELANAIAAEGKETRF